ncbi:hypothetical protein GGI00_002193 [Coemansia sp. RSA 2681]|nr:hypothetical protein GGI00_002193 [Coemansia sp. RSA 2681]
MSAPLASVVPAVAESLDALEAHQQTLLEQLRAIHTQLSLGAKGEDDDELLPTLTFYINQAGHVQRKMMLIHGRVSDMKRRAERLRAHRAKQDRKVAEWMAQERARQVPAAQASPALMQGRAFSPASGHESASPDARGDQASSRSVHDADEPGAAVLEQRPASLAATTGLGIEGPNAESAGSRPATPATSAGDAALPVATIKRKGKRRVRMTTIE